MSWARLQTAGWLLFLALGMSGSLAGCQEGAGTDVVVELSSNEEEEIVSLVKTIEMWFDAEGGFVGVGPTTQLEDFALEDFDKDGLPELKLEMTIKNKRLPRVRLEPGSNLKTPISIQVMGLDANEKPVAIGGTNPQILFVQSQRKTVQVFFARIGTSVNPESLPQIRLEPEPLFNSLAQVLAPISTIEVVLDLEGGIDEQDTFISKFIREDVDGDGQSELVQRIPWSGESAMPEVAIDAAITPSKLVRINARGLTAQGQVAAYGGARFIFGTRQEIEVPLNLTRAFLPPRIVGFAPMTFPKALYPSSLGFYASKTLNPDSVAQSTHFVVHLSSGTTTELPVMLQYRDCPFGTQMWKATPKACYESSSLLITLTAAELVIDPQLTDTNGVPITPANTVRFKLPLSSTWHIGPCNPSKPCEDQVAGFHPPDAFCNRSNHLFEPTPCNLSTSGSNCQGERDVLDWAHPESQAQCAQWNPDSAFSQGSCALTSTPRPCDEATCATIGQACQDTCNLDPLVCDPSQGCLPRLMGCAQNCFGFGGCPDVRQVCSKVSDNVFVCR